MDAFNRIQLVSLMLMAVLLAGCQSESNESVAETAQAPAAEVTTEPPTAEPATDPFTQSVMDWREGRVNRLIDPYGWLSMSGYYLMEEGTHSIGSAEDNDIVVSGGPSLWGQFTRVGETVRFESADPDRVLVDDQPQDSVEMLSSAFTEGEPTRIESEGVRVQLSRSGGVPNLRMRNPDAETRTGFLGLDYYDPDPAYRFEAEFIPHEEGNTMRVANVMGQIINEANPGIVRFEHDGQMFELETFLYGDELFIVFADRTSGNETYGLGRFLYADLPVDGKTTVDFNRSYNPPCAFTEYTTCSLPPQSNRMDAFIRAGEKSYQGKAGMTREKVMEVSVEL